MGKIKVLEVVGSLRMGGLETVAINFFRYSDKSKYEFYFLTYQKGNEKEFFEDEVKKLGGKIIKIDSPKKGMFKFIKSVKKIIKNENYKIVHSHTFYNSGIIMYIASKLNVPIRITHIHTNNSMKNQKFIKVMYNFIMKNLIKKYSTKVCACSKEAGILTCGKKYFKEYGIVVNNCIDIDKYKFSSENRKNIRNNLKINENEIVIGNIGRIEKVKNQIFLLNILKKLNDTKFKLVIAGDGTLKKFLEDKAKEYGIINNVIFLGNISNVSEVLSAFDIFALPSEHEGFGLVLLEAQANGLKCLASKENIPDSVKILDNFKFISLIDMTQWIYEIKNKTNLKRNEKATEILKEQGYDIKDFSNYIKNLYKI